MEINQQKVLKGAKNISLGYLLCTKVIIGHLYDYNSFNPFSNGSMIITQRHHKLHCYILNQQNFINI